MLNNKSSISFEMNVDFSLLSKVSLIWNEYNSKQFFLSYVIKQRHLLPQSLQPPYSKLKFTVFGGNSSLLIIHKDRYFGKISRTVSVSLKLVEEIVDFGYTTKQFWPYCLNSVCTRAIRCLGSKRCLSKINIFEFFLYSENSFRAVRLIEVHLIL